jgi:hypothetical protein
MRAYRAGETGGDGGPPMMRCERTPQSAPTVLVQTGPAPARATGGVLAQTVRKMARGNWILVESRARACEMQRIVKQLGGSSTVYKIDASSEQRCFKVLDAPWIIPKSVANSSHLSTP